MKTYTPSHPQIYYGPELDPENFDTTTLHWINFFGDQKNIQDRILQVLEINQQVIHNNHYFYDLEHIISTHITYTLSVHTYKQSIKEIFKEYLYSNNQLLDTSKTQHHIIFKNKHTQGHPHAYGHNGYTIERGLHTSFHELMHQKKLFPHEHFTRLLTMEKDILCIDSRTSLIEFEKKYHRIFMKNPLLLYRKECFHPKIQWSL